MEYCPDIAVLTNISEAHLEFMKTYEHYTEVKGRLFKNHTKDHTAINVLSFHPLLKIYK